MGLLARDVSGETAVPAAEPGGLNPAKLANVRDRGDRLTARCPACAEAGADTAGEHLSIDWQGRFGCVAHPGSAGAMHRRRIWELTGQPAPGRSVGTGRPAPHPPAPTRAPARTWPTPEDAARACCPAGASVEALYEYPATSGAPFAAVARYRTADGKTFRQYRHTSAGWAPGAPAGPWPLWGWAELAARPGEAVYVAEGEKATLAARSVGLLTVCSAGGSAAAAKTDWALLAGRDVRLLPDNDAAGAGYAADVAALLARLDHPASVRRVDLPGLADLGEGADVADWLEARDATDTAVLRATIENAVAPAPAVTGPIAAADWLTFEPPAPEWIVDGVFEPGARVLVVAPSKCRKSFFALQLALCVAAGRPFLGMPVPRPRRVLLVNMENPSAWEHRRFLRMAEALGIVAADLGAPCRLLVWNGRGAGLDLAAIEAEAGRGPPPELIVLDPVYKLDPGEENDQTARKLLLAQIERVGTATGAAASLVHHDPKGQAGDRDARDRGSGSNIVNRDVDAILALTPWGDPRDSNADALAVLSILARNSPPRPDVALLFHDGAFAVDPTRTAVKATSRTRAVAGRSPEGDAKADARALARILEEGDARKLSDARRMAAERFGKRRGERAFEELASDPAAFGLALGTARRNGVGFVGRACSVADAVATYDARHGGKTENRRENRDGEKA